MRKNHLFARTLFIGMMLFFGISSAKAENPFDYVGLNNLYSYHMERLDAQEREINEDLAYIDGAIQTLDYAQRAAKLRVAAQRCRERLASGELTTCSVSFSGSYISIEAAEAKAREFDAKAKQCKKCKDEATRDRAELAKRATEIGRIRNDFKEWKKENEDAVSEAIMTVAEFALGKAAKYFADQAKSADAFKAWITKYESQLTKDGANVPVLLEKIQRVSGKYFETKLMVTTGKVLEKTEPITLYTTVNNTVSSVMVAESGCDDDVKALMSDPVVQKYLNKDGAAKALGEKLLEKGAEDIFKAFPGTSKLVPALGIGLLLKDSSYSGLKWWLSLKMIGMRFTLTEQSGNAVHSLHNLIERRKAQWGKCL